MCQPIMKYKPKCRRGLTHRLAPTIKQKKYSHPELVSGSQWD
ncbi:hypothetical protein BBG19_1103 [Francisella sp. MA067296]|nr:hypothetical protein BBG19_1103 [Francisella sp. MA067296]